MNLELLFVPIALLVAGLAGAFEHPRGEPVQVEVLTAGESIDYGWCRAYPGPEGSTRSPAAPATGAPPVD